MKKQGIRMGLAAVGAAALLAGCLIPAKKESMPSTAAASERAAAETVREPAAGDTLLSATVQEKVGDIQELIDRYYFFEPESEQMAEGLYAGLVAGLGDPYSVYYTAEQYQRLMEATNGSYCGIGAMVSQDRNTGVMTVVRVFEGTPAEEGGLLPEDKIVAVDGIEVTGLDLDLVVSQYVKGVEGTEVVLLVYRASTGEYLELPMTRRVVEIPTVTAKMLESEVGYVEVSQFDMVTAAQFASAIEGLEAQGMKGLVIDLRDNPGGTLDTVVDMMDYILPDDLTEYSPNHRSTVLLSMEDKEGSCDSYMASDGHEVKLPMAVLVNGNSASASEVFAGAMQDYEWATLVGTTTFGKGIVQSLFPLADGTAVKLTVSSYSTPAGRNIHGLGIEPDVAVELDEGLNALASIPPEQDNQLQKAIEIVTR